MPISVLPTLSKIIEKWFSMKRMSYLNLRQKQSGFRSGHSTETALILMADTWLNAINIGTIVGCVLVDIRKAFDFLDHKLLLQKLRHYKNNNLSLSWFDSYLDNRTQQVIINGNELATKTVLCGMPHGSILCPQLFPFL